ncbi:MAG: hydrogenase 3 maturation endopeptidase HyCI [Gammaproteobacteria bacterium]
MSSRAAETAGTAVPALVQRLDPGRLRRGRVCVLGIGNRERGDDAAGSLLAESLAGRVGATVIDAGAVPENYLGKVVGAAPDTVVIVDAVDLGAAPGTVATVSPEQLRAGGLSTHAVSLAMAVDYLAARSGAAIVVIGIQPAALDAPRAVSAPVARGIARLRDALIACLAPAPETQGDS